MTSTNHLLFICSLKSVCSSLYLSIQVVNPSTSFVIPTVSSPLMTPFLKSDPINSIRLPWDLPLSAAPHSMGPSLNTLDGHVE